MDILKEIESIKKEIDYYNQQKAIAESQLNDIQEELKKHELTLDSLPGEIEILSVEIDKLTKELEEQVKTFKEELK